MKTQQSLPSSTDHSTCFLPARVGKRLLALAFAIFLAANARANFHLWDVAEIYSNEDGSVQFLELFTASANQEVLTGHQIQCNGPGGTNTFTFPSNLSIASFTTANRSFILGTTNLTSIPGGLRPDYVIPANFLLRGSGVTNTLNFGVSPTQDIVIYINLPTDGIGSLVRSGVNMIFNATNSPKNYFNQSNSIVPLKISAAAVAGTNLSFSFIAAKGTNFTSGLSYTVQYKDSVSSTIWTTLTNFAGVTNNTTRMVTNGIDSSERYYRLKAP